MIKPNAIQIQKAVDWWVEVIRSPKHDNGDENLHGGFARAVVSLGVQKVTDEEIEIFRRELSNLLLIHEQAKWGLHVDYSPDIILAEALRRANISEFNVPWKTNMNFYPNGSVKVSYGYGAQWKEI